MSVRLRAIGCALFYGLAPSLPEKPDRRAVDRLAESVISEALRVGP